MPLPQFLNLLPQPFWLWFVLAVLATWRLTLILHQEKIAKPIRDLVGIRELKAFDEITRQYPDTFLGRLFECFMCLSVWVSLGVFGLLLIFPLAVVPLAISMAAIGLQLLIFER